MLKIYFGSSITQGRKYHEQAKLIVKTLEKLGNQVISKYVIDPSLTGKEQDPQQLFNREITQIKTCDCMVAEVSQASWGTAFLMDKAIELDKPVIALYYENGSELSPMVEGNPGIYTRYYTEHNLQVVLRKTLAHIYKTTKERQGKLIVIDGADGSGKETQARRLAEYLRQQGQSVRYIDFPRYYTSFYGKMVGKMLRGEFGSKEEISPYLASLFYALDRVSARDSLLSWLSTGQLVVANRYTTSSMAFQAAKIDSQKKQESFINWVYELEYQQNNLPKEDIVIFLDLPAEVSRSLLEKKKASSRQYLQGDKYDVNEKDLAYQRQVLKMYRRLAAKYSHWRMVDCLDKSGKILSIKAIHQKVVKTLQDNNILS